MGPICPYLTIRNLGTSVRILQDDSCSDEVGRKWEETAQMTTVVNMFDLLFNPCPVSKTDFYSHYINRNVLNTF